MRRVESAAGVGEDDRLRARGDDRAHGVDNLVGGVPS